MLETVPKENKNFELLTKYWPGQAAIHISFLAILDSDRWIDNYQVAFTKWTRTVVRSTTNALDP